MPTIRERKQKVKCNVSLHSYLNRHDDDDDNENTLYIAEDDNEEKILKHKVN